MDEFVVDGAATAAGWYYGRGRTRSSSSSRGAVIFIGEDDPTRIDVVGVVIVRQCLRRRRHHHSEDIDGYFNFTMKAPRREGGTIGILVVIMRAVNLFNKNNYCRQCRVTRDGVKVVKP